MDLVQIVQTRYSTKKYNPNKKIPEDQFQKIIELLHLTPSSINSQPFHFIIASNPEGKHRVAKSMDEDAYRFNYNKIIDSSHSIVICSKTSIDRAYLKKTMDQAQKDGRIDTDEKKEKMIDQYMGFVDYHNNITKDPERWMQKQCYIALGNLLLGAAILGIDATPIEGFDMSVMDKEFDLKSQGYTSLVVISLGYRADDDPNAKLPKSRLPKEDFFTFC